MSRACATVRAERIVSERLLRARKFELPASCFLPAFCGSSPTMPRDPEQPLSAAGLRFWGLFMVALGALIMLAAAGVLPSKAGDAPAWVVACAASLFVFAGCLLVLRSF